jgi:hypothetical protein
VISRNRSLQKTLQIKRPKTQTAKINQRIHVHQTNTKMQKSIASADHTTHLNNHQTTITTRSKVKNAQGTAMNPTATTVTLSRHPKNQKSAMAIW